MTPWPNMLIGYIACGLLSVRRMRHLKYITVVLGCLCLTGCGPDGLYRFDNPLTYSEAAKNKDINFPLPSSSHDIYYGQYANWQEYTKIVRFQAPIQDCISQIDVVITWNSKGVNQTSSYPHITITNVEPPGADSLAPASWFTPETIKHGIYAGQISSYAPQIWVDTDRGIFYFKQTD